jgi:hypothetical protein
VENTFSGKIMSGSAIFLWLVFGLTAIMALVKMMRLRQLHLIELLKKYVELHAAWQRRMDRASELMAENDAKTSN